MNLEVALTIIAGLVGLPALWSVIIDVLKYFEVIKEGEAPRWNAAFSALTLIGVLVAVNFFQNVDLVGIDKLLAEIAKFAGIILSFLTQVLVAKGTHALTKVAVPKLTR